MVKKVYLGEDTPTQALFLRGILSREGDIEPVVFGDGLNLYLAIQKEPPDLIISDNVLPSIDGLALARLVKFHEETQHVPFLLVSSMTKEQIGLRDEDGVDAFLPKPLKIPQLKEMVSRLLGRASTPLAALRAEDPTL
jgi:CheY-like chemotaxis protein